MKEGHVTIYATKCAITGPPGSGKSNLRSLILNEKRPTIRRSTPVATEATQATPDFIPSIQEDMVAVGQNDGEWMIVDDAKMKELVASGLKEPKLDDDQAETSSADSEEDVPMQPKLKKTAVQVSHEPTHPVKLRIHSEIRRLSRNPRLKSDCLHEMRFVYLVDTGGQPQFQEILPMFVRNASVNLLVFKLSDKLSDCPTFEYFLDGKKYCEPEKLRLTNQEIIEHSARSVFSCSQTREIKRVRQKPEQPAVVLVGTFKDQSNCCPETLEQKQGTLLECLKPYINRDGIIGASRKMMIFDIDGSEEGWSKNHIIATLCAEVIFRSKSLKIDMPLRWFMFQLELKDHAKKHNLDFVTLKVCYDIGRQLQMKHADVRQVLLFLDEVNIILYYPNILRDVVFCNPQFLLGKVTEIIVASFDCLEQAVDRFGSYLTFHNEGIFSPQLISEFQDGYNEYFSQKDLLLLLQELLIIARVGDDCYFMPCVLPVEQASSNIRRQLLSDSNFEPLVFSFPSGYSPRGMFCALIVYLTSQVKSHTWNITTNNDDLVRKRNLIEFNITSTIPSEPIGTVVIEDTLSLFVVYAYCEPEYCPEIRLTVYTAVLHATEKLFYDHSKIECEVGFFCDGSCGVKDEHCAAVVSDRTKVKCTKKKRRNAKRLTEKQKPWFDAATSSFNVEGKFDTTFVSIR